MGRISTNIQLTLYIIISTCGTFSPVGVSCRFISQHINDILLSNLNLGFPSLEEWVSSGESLESHDHPIT
ncbi:uncharacterized protein YALI1_A10448g [Yarrowia lipolytica]|uniref:Uncharacterized protein n=1 Tax=Yarrowia lipolytica TaxID=4952 RepID=A0A1D8N4D6_YARLL|nr:hypothetical protein YALI1_A10448g [Yarrowia lipolytica]